MSTVTLEEADLVLLYIDDIPHQYFDDFRETVNDNGLKLAEDSRKNAPYAALEWFIPTAIAIYVGKKFIDAFFKKAADDVADTVYPQIKKAIFDLINKILVQDRNLFGVDATSEKKVTNPNLLTFSVYSETRSQKHLKFVFHEEFSDAEYKKCVEQIFVIIRDHHLANGDEDRLSQAIANVGNTGAGQVILQYNRGTCEWEVINPLQEIQKLKAKQDENTI